MDVILELLVTALAWGLYGTEDRPRHPIFRNTVRVIAFAGAFVSMGLFLGLLGDLTLPLAVTIIWGLCALIVISGEYYLGSERIAMAGVVVALLWLATVLVYISGAS